jgi:hypothetical protein
VVSIDPLGPHAPEPFLVRKIGEPGPLPLEDVAGEILDVAAVVAVVGHLGVAAHELQETRLDRGAETIHLAARVVEVVLALDRPAGGLEQAGQRVADRRVARVPERERTGRVRAHELHLRPAAVGRRATVLGPVGQHLAESVVQPLVGREQVQEPGSRDLGFLEERRRRQRVGDRLRHVARGLAGALGEPERDVRGEVTVIALLRGEQLGGRQFPLDAEAGRRGHQRLGEQVDEPSFDHGAPASASRTVATRASGSKGFVT